jgi:hypothetical protein
MTDYWRKGEKEKAGGVIDGKEHGFFICNNICS